MAAGASPSRRPPCPQGGGGGLFPGGWGHTGQWPEEALGCDTGKGAAGRPVNLGPRRPASRCPHLALCLRWGPRIPGEARGVLGGGRSCQRGGAQHGRHTVIPCRDPVNGLGFCPRSETQNGGHFAERWLSWGRRRLHRTGSGTAPGTQTWVGRLCSTGLMTPVGCEHVDTARVPQSSLEAIREGTA